jgi:hypothetical protein
VAGTTQSDIARVLGADEEIILNDWIRAQAADGRRGQLISDAELRSQSLDFLRRPRGPRARLE